MLTLAETDEFDGADRITLVKVLVESVLAICPRLPPDKKNAPDLFLLAVVKWWQITVCLRVI